MHVLILYTYIQMAKDKSKLIDLFWSVEEVEQPMYLPKPGNEEIDNDNSQPLISSSSASSSFRDLLI